MNDTLTRTILPTFLCAIAFAGCSGGGPDPMRTGPGPLTDAGPMTRSPGPLTDDLVLAELANAQVVALCEETDAAYFTPSQEQACTMDALYEGTDAASCASSRDACLMQPAPPEEPYDCAANAAQEAMAFAGCTGTVGQYRACTSASNAQARSAFERADCSLVGMGDSLWGEEPPSCASLVQACPSLFPEEPEM